MALTSDFTGRKVDHFIFQGATPRGEALIAMEFDPAGLITTGVQKVSQTWTILFLTVRGSAFEQDKGTNFITAMRTGRIRTDNNVIVEFASAAELIKVQMDGEEAIAELPLDERLDDAELLDFSLDFNVSLLKLFVRITSLAEEGIDLFVPIPLAIK